MPPQAKLPGTWPKVENEQKMSPEQYPGVKTPEYSYQANYSEGQINGYRWYDKHGVKPAFPVSAASRAPCAVRRPASVCCSRPQAPTCLPA